MSYNTEKLKSHSDYVITNSAWKLMEMSLSQYLNSIKLYNVKIYAGISQFYLRQRYYNQSELTVIKDPWNRQFPYFVDDVVE